MISGAFGAVTTASAKKVQPKLLVTVTVNEPAGIIVRGFEPVPGCPPQSYEKVVPPVGVSVMLPVELLQVVCVVTTLTFEISGAWVIFAETVVLQPVGAVMVTV
jgi:hypothetical protein